MFHIYFPKPKHDPESDFWWRVFCATLIATPFVGLYYLLESGKVGEIVGMVVIVAFIIVCFWAALSGESRDA